MFQQGKFASFRSAIGDLVTGLVFTSVIALVVGGTTLMCLERSIAFA
jgi:hypothetical protein